MNSMYIIWDCLVDPLFGKEMGVFLAYVFLSRSWFGDTVLGDGVKLYIRACVSEWFSYFDIKRFNHLFWK